MFSQQLFSPEGTYAQAAFVTKARRLQSDENLTNGLCAPL